MQHRVPSAVGSSFKHDASVTDAALGGCPVQRSIAALNWVGVRHLAIRNREGEVMDDRVVAAVGKHPEDRPKIPGTAGVGRPVQRAVAGLNQPTPGRKSIKATGEAVEDREAAAVGQNFKNRAAVAGATVEGCPVKRSIAALEESVAAR